MITAPHSTYMDFGISKTNNGVDETHRHVTGHTAEGGSDANGQFAVRRIGWH
jgi:hypothetical protein